MNSIRRKFHWIFLLLILFRFPAANFAAPFAFVQLTDSHIGTSNTAAQLDSIVTDLHLLSPAPQFVIHTGDQTERGTIAELAQLDSILKRINLPIYHVPGNHETRWAPAGKNLLKKKWNQLFHSFQFENCDFLLLDSSMLLEHYGHISNTQLRWLKQQLKKNTQNQPLILACHHPPAFEKSYIDNDFKLLNLLSEHNPVLFLCGHGHQNRHWRINGIDFFMTTATYGKHPGYRYFQVTADSIFVFSRDLRSQTTTCTLRRSLLPLKAPDWRLKFPRLTERLQPGDFIEFPDDPDGNFSYRVGAKSWQNLPSNQTSLKITPDLIPAGFSILQLKTTQPETGDWLQNFPVEKMPSIPALNWQEQVNQDLQATPRVAPNQLIVPTLGGLLLAFNKVTGEKKWELSLNSPLITTPAVCRDTIWVTTTGGQCVALKGNPPQILWEKKVSEAIFSSPAYCNGLLYFGTSSGNMVCLSGNSGALKWKFKTSGHIKCQPAVAENTVVFGSWDGFFYAVDALLGKLKWQQKISDNPYFPAATSNPLISNKHVVVTSHDHTAHAFDLLTGNVIWQHLREENQLCGYSSPAVWKNQVIFGSLSGHVFALDQKTGATMWSINLRTPPDAVFDSSPIIKANHCFVGSISGNLYAIDLQQKAVKWSFQAGLGYIFASPVTSGNSVIIGTVSGEIFSLPH